MSSGRVTMVAAYAENRVIGADGGMPWHIGEDFAHFKATTMGGVMIMGRATWDSIGRPLPGRATVVLTRDPAWAPATESAAVHVAHSIESALDLAEALPGEIYVVGGAQIYELAMPYATDQALTEVHAEAAGDAYYPEFDAAVWTEVRRVPRPDLGLDWVWWERRTPSAARPAGAVTGQR